MNGAFFPKWFKEKMNKSCNMQATKKMQNMEVESSNNFETDIEGEIVDQQPKKRGRKPKNKDVVVEEVDPNKQVGPKKRGRRPKDKTYTVISNYKEVPADVEEDNIILHLPMENDVAIANENDIKIETNGVLRYDPNLNEPLPYEPMNSMMSGFALISDKIQERINDVDEVSEHMEKYGSQFDEISDIKCDNDEVFIRDIGFEEDDKEYFKVLKKAKILKLMSSDETKKDWELSSDCCCFNCTEKFQTVPIGIPLRYFRGKFFCRDNFCSFNCAARYIFLGPDMKYHFKKWEYYSLLCLMANKINKEINNKTNDNNQCVKVKMADDPKLLKKFGGPLSIEQYRSNFYILDSQHSILYPPLSCMYPQAEIANYVNVHRQKAQLLNSDSRFSFADSKSSATDLKLKRDKPLIQKKNTLEEYMSLKIN